MTELRLALSMGAIRAIVDGEELVFDVPGEPVRVYLRCDDETVNNIKEQIEKALLHMLPPGPHLH